MFPRLTGIVNHAATIDVIARPDRSTPGVGFWDLYVVEQDTNYRGSLQFAVENNREEKMSVEVRVPTLG